MNDKKGTYIFVVDRGFVLVARAKLSTELAFHWDLECARVIQRWGTSQGLSQLVNGPLEVTVLQAKAEEFLPQRAILRIIKVEEEAWSPHL